jgi:hypothetical protein
MTWSIDSVFVPEAELRRLRELAAEREVALALSKGWRAYHVEEARKAALLGYHDRMIETELHQYRPEAWNELLDVLIPLGLERLRRTGMGEPEIELRRMLTGAGPDFAQIRVTGGDVDAILAKNPKIAGDPDVRRALDRLDAPPVTDGPVSKPGTSSEALETHAQSPVHVTEPLDPSPTPQKAENAESTYAAPEAGPGSPFVWRSEKNRGPGLLPDKF